MRPVLMSPGRIAKLAIIIAMTVIALLLAACSKSGSAVSRYHCPMHPTYIYDKPGDCPICGMRLVPIEEGKVKPAASPSNADGGAPVWTCPMDSDVVSDKPGRCPKCGMALEPKGARAAPAVDPGGARRILCYRSPMDPKVTSPTPAKDSMGMDFVPVYSDEVRAPGAGIEGMAPIDVDPEGLRLAGVRTAVAERGRIERTIRAVGVVRPEETRIRHVHTKTSGYIEKLFIDFTGQPVKKGRPILSMYSPELLASQQEYTRAREAAANLPKSNDPTASQAAEQMLSGARRRLELFDVPASSIAELERSGSARRTVTLLAPVSGIVTSKGVFEGMQVEPGTELFTVSDLSSVWIEADVYENEASVVKVGQEAKLTLAYQPGTEMKGKVKYIYPYLNPETRTLKVRFDFPNPGLALKLDMYVTVELPVQSEEGVIVPDSAIIDTGLRQVVFVNPSEGRFEPRVVKVGIRADGRAQILSGAAAGERVAIKANFLIDSESRLRAAISAGAPAPAVSAQPSTGPSP
jgi:membrane fusion protein, copper/silver efflux system